MLKNRWIELPIALELLILFPIYAIAFGFVGAAIDSVMPIHIDGTPLARFVHDGVRLACGFVLGLYYFRLRQSIRERNQAFDKGIE